MDNWQTAAERILAGPEGQRLRALAESQEAARMGRDPRAAEVARAARSGDTEALRRALSALLSSPEGKALAARLEREGPGHG